MVPKAQEGTELTGINKPGSLSRCLWASVRLRLRRAMQPQSAKTQRITEFQRKQMLTSPRADINDGAEQWLETTSKGSSSVSFSPLPMCLYIM